MSSHKFVSCSLFSLNQKALSVFIISPKMIALVDFKTLIPQAEVVSNIPSSLDGPKDSCANSFHLFSAFFPLFFFLFSFPPLRWSNGQHFCLTHSAYPGLVPKPEGEEMAFFLRNFALTVLQSHTTLTCLFLALL